MVAHMKKAKDTCEEAMGSRSGFQARLLTAREI